MLVICVAIAIVRVVITLLAGGDSHEWHRRARGARFAKIVQAMPDIARISTSPRLVVGSSALTVGLDVDEFDAALAEHGLTGGPSINLSVPAATPEMEWLVASTARRAFLTADRRAQFAIVRFPQDMATHLTTKNYFVPRTAALARAGHIEHFALLAQHRPEDVVRALAWRWVYAGAVPGHVREALWELAQPPVADDSPRGVLVGFRRDVFNVWSLENGGELPPAPVPNFFELAQSALSSDPEGTIATLAAQNDYLELRFDDYQIECTERAVRDVQAISDHVFLFIAPERREWFERDPRVEERLSTTFRGIAERTGATPIDMRDDLSGDMFLDATHARPDTGGVELSRMLAARIADTLVE
jgi:hypothetical protein